MDAIIVVCAIVTAANIIHIISMLAWDRKRENELREWIDAQYPG